MSDPDSTITVLNGKQSMNPFRSRSTVIALACLWTLLAIVMTVCLIAWKTGYFSMEFAALIFSNSVLILSKIIEVALGHQLKADQNNTTNKTS